MGSYKLVAFYSQIVMLNQTCYNSNNTIQFVTSEGNSMLSLNLPAGKYRFVHTSVVSAVFWQYLNDFENLYSVDNQDNLIEFDLSNGATVYVNVSGLNPDDYEIYKYDEMGLDEDVKDEISDSLLVVNNRLMMLEKLHENEQIKEQEMPVNDNFKVAQNYMPYLSWEMYKERFTAYNVALPVTDMHKYLREKMGSYAFAEKIRVTGFVPNFKNRVYDAEGAFAIRFKMTDDNWFGDKVNETPRVLILPENSIVDKTLNNIPFDTIEFGVMKRNGQFLNVDKIDMDSYTSNKKEQLKLDFEFLGFLNWD